MGAPSEVWLGGTLMLVVEEGGRVMRPLASMGPGRDCCGPDLQDGIMALSGGGEAVSRLRLISTFALASTLALAASSEAWAKRGEEHWVAFSKTAMSITGDIVLSPSRLNADGYDFPLRAARDLPNYGAFFGSVPARVLRVMRPMDPKLMNGNRLGCGHPIQWIVVYRFDNGMLGMDVFEGADLPTMVSDPGMCGTYTYTRP